jgi:hypothetical protein
VNNTQLLHLTDFKLRILNPMFVQLNAACMESVSVYMQSLLQNSIIAYSVFVSVLIITAFIIVFKGLSKTKANMTNTNIVLGILPFEDLSKEEC